MGCVSIDLHKRALKVCFLIAEGKSATRASGRSNAALPSCSRAGPGSSASAQSSRHENASLEALTLSASCSPGSHHSKRWSIRSP